MLKNLRGAICGGITAVFISIWARHLPLCLVLKLSHLGIIVIVNEGESMLPGSSLLQSRLAVTSRFGICLMRRQSGVGICLYSPRLAMLGRAGMCPPAGTFTHAQTNARDIQYNADSGAFRPLSSAVLIGYSRCLLKLIRFQYNTDSGACRLLNSVVLIGVPLSLTRFFTHSSAQYNRQGTQPSCFHRVFLSLSSIRISNCF